MSPPSGFLCPRFPTTIGRGSFSFATRFILAWLHYPASKVSAWFRFCRWPRKAFLLFILPARTSRPPSRRTGLRQIIESLVRVIFARWGIPLLSGRYFTDEDESHASPVVLISSVVAGKHFSDRSPIGQQILIDDNDAAPRPVEIVGVVAPVKQTTLER